MIRRCSTELELWHLIESSRDLSDVAAHVSSCEACRLKLLRLRDESNVSGETKPRSRFLQFISPDDGESEGRPLQAPVESGMEQRSTAADGFAKSPLVRRILNKYELREQISRGGQATVYRGRDLRLDREVAIKVGHRPLEGDGLDICETLHEGMLLARIDHPALARVYDVDIDGGFPCLIMEYVEGTTLRDFSRQRTLRPRQIQKILLEIAAALAAAHRAGVLHLDLKPENVLVTSSGRCRLIDFGMGWLLSRSSRCPLPMICGTPEYMAPEQHSGRSSAWDQQTDIFGLGTILFDLLTHSAPWPKDVAPADLPRQLQAALHRLHQAGADSRLTRICCKAMALEADERYQDVDAFCEALTFRCRMRQRVLAATQILLGCVLMSFGLMSLFTETPKSVNVKPASTLESKFSPASPRWLKLRIYSSGPQRPEVSLWTPTLRAHPLKLKSINSNGAADCWQLHTMDGTVCMELADSLLAFVAFQRRRGRPADLSRDLAPLATAGEEDWEPQAPGTWLLSSRRKLTPQEFPPGRLGNFLKNLQTVFLASGDRYVCLVISQGAAEAMSPEISAELDLRDICEEKGRRDRDRCRHKIRRESGLCSDGAL